MARLIEDNFKMEDFHHCHDCDSILQVIKSKPTVDAESVRHGHWIDRTPVMSHGKLFKCSRCGRIVVLGMSESNLNVSEIYPYCHCGAKMDEDELK